MNARLWSALPFLGLIAACATQDGQVRSVSADTYEVGYYAGLKPLSWVEIKNRTLQSADAYCETLNKKMIDPVITSNKATGLKPKEAITRFKCVPKTQDVTAAR